MITLMLAGFEGTLIFETLSFVGVGSLFILAWAVAKAMGHADPQIHLRRFVACSLELLRPPDALCSS